MIRRVRFRSAHWVLMIGCIVSSLSSTRLAARAKTPAFHEILASMGLEPGDLKVGAQADWLGHPAISAIPNVLPHVEAVRSDPKRLVVLGTNLLHVVGNTEAKPSSERGIVDLFSAMVLQPRLAGFRGIAMQLPERRESSEDDERGAYEFDDLPPLLGPIVESLVDSLIEASALVDRSWRRLPSSTLTEAIDHQDVPRLLSGGSVFWPAIDDSVALGDDVDRAAAALIVLTAIERSLGQLEGMDPSIVDYWERMTPRGRIVVAGSAAHRHDHCSSDCLLLLDLGGNDFYGATAGAAFATRQPVSVVLDLDGDDVYQSEGQAPAQGAGLGGVGVLVDSRGDDLYEAGDRSQGFGMLGYGILWDRAGKDRYRGSGGVQGSALFGGGLLLDEDGDDVYRLLGEGQGFGGPGACGALVDLAGDDDYFAEPDSEINESRADYHSEGRTAANNAQGAGVGRRGDLGDGHVWAGGVGILADYRGDDRYRAGNFSQAAGYWYGTGLLLDDSGNDVYESVYFSQGSGAHFSLALLYDGRGDDRHVLTQEAGASLAYGWDFALSLLVDGQGDDSYEAKKTSLGAAHLSSLALFLELGGNDDYEIANPSTAFGWSGTDKGSGGDGPIRAADLAEQIGVFIDLEGEDRYPGGGKRQTNNQNWVRGLDANHVLRSQPVRWLTAEDLP